MMDKCLLWCWGLDRFGWEYGSYKSQNKGKGMLITNPSVDGYACRVCTVYASCSQWSCVAKDPRGPVIYPDEHDATAQQDGGWSDRSLLLS